MKKYTKIIHTKKAKENYNVAHSCALFDKHKDNCYIKNLLAVSERIAVQIQSKIWWLNFNADQKIRVKGLWCWQNTCFVLITCIYNNIWKCYNILHNTITSITSIFIGIAFVSSVCQILSLLLLHLR